MAKKATDLQLTELLGRGVDDIIGKDELIKQLKSGKKLRIKHGVDPTTRDLHLGYAVVYEKLRQFQELGHTIIFLIGDFTARFGDPTDKIRSRTLRSKKEVRALAKNYLKQVGKILDMEKTEVAYNGDWYDAMSAEELISLMTRFTHARLIERDMFEKRIAAQEEIGFHEMVYPILQGYDSVMLKSDVTVNGTDQIFNELQGRKLQEINGQKPQSIVAVPLLIGTDGTQKMSQSLGNYIGLDDSPDEMFGKVMSIPDSLIPQYLELLTRLPQSSVDMLMIALEEGENPRTIKFKLAEEIVANYHDRDKALRAGERFNRVFREKKLPTDISAIVVPKKQMSVVDLIVALKMTESRSDARRMIKQGAVTIDEARINDMHAVITPHKGMVVRVGKRRIAKIK